MNDREKLNRGGRIVVRAALAVALALGAGGSAFAGGGDWSVTVEPMYLELFGHDQHVLTVHEIDDGPPRSVERYGTVLDTDGAPGYRSEVRYTRSGWTWGFDFLWFKTNQSAPSRSSSASGQVDEVVFEVAGRDYRSTGPGESLYYRSLGDTAIALWTVDLYGLKTLAEGPDSRIRLQFGLRSGDFDNDYHAVVGIEGQGGTLIDASSNYDRMDGLNLGLAGEHRFGRNRFDAYLGQSLLLGSVELSNLASDYSGAYEGEDHQDFDATEQIHVYRDVAIPISEFRFRWRYEISERFSLGAGVFSSVWWDVPVAPGVIPGEQGNQVLHENTLYMIGLTGAATFRF